MSVTVVYPAMSISMLYQGFIMLFLLVYCVSITKKSDMSITLIYHSVSLSMLS
jgi:hypothetical protein